MDIYPDKEHWLGGVFVPPEHRKKGVATELLKRTLELAKKLRVTTLYLQTERLDGGIYATLGWRPIEKIFCIQSGMLNLKTRKGSWVVPPGRLGWITADVEHAACSLGDIVGWSVYGEIHRDLCSDACVLRSTSLLEALLERVADRGKLNTRLSRDKSLATLIQSELSTVEKEPLGLIFPTSLPLRRVAERLMGDEAIAIKVPELAKMAGMSVRSFSRHFHRETGISFNQWRHKAIHHKAIEVIGSGESVTSAALTLGYDSVSAFIASFGREYGMSPMKFIKKGLG
ncbi:unnamed protein product [Sphagnum balticum]